MRMSTMRTLTDEYRAGALSVKRKIVRKCWESDGLDGIEALSLLSGVQVDQLAAIAGIGPNVGRALARRERAEQVTRRQPIPRGFRREARDIASRAAHGRGFLPKRHWDPL